MKTHLQFFLVSMLISGCLISQEFTWAKNFGINSTFFGLAVVSDNSGNVYFTGTYSGSGDQDPSQGTFVLNNNGDGDIFVAKLDASGKMLWAKSLGSPWSDAGRGIAVDAAGNVYVSGNFRGIVDFDPGPGTFTLQSPINQNIYDSDAFILKLDNNGNFGWAGAISGERDEVITDMTIKNNKIFVTGNYGGSTDFDIKPDSTSTLNGALNNQVFVASYNLNGSLNWVSTINGESRSTALALDGSDNIYVTGYYWGTADFDPAAGTVNMTPAGGEDVYVWKLNATGSLVWARSAGGSNNEEGNDLVADAAGNVYYTGYFQFVADLDPGAGISSFTAVPGTDQMDKGTDIFVSKLSASGDLVWAKAMGGIGYDHGDAIALDLAGNVYVGGNFKYKVDFDPSYLNAFLEPINSFEDIFLQKLNTNGDLLWLGQIGGDGADELRSMYIHNDNSIYLTGMFKSTADLDPTTGTSMVASAGLVNGFVIKLNGNVNLTLAGLQEQQTLSQILLYPNPAKGVLTADNVIGECQLTVYNAQGAMVKELLLNQANPSVNLVDLSPGIYIIEIKQGSIVERKKIIVE